MDCGIVVSDFVLPSRYYVHFRANPLGKGMNSPYPSSYGLNSTTTVLLALALDNVQRLICHKTKKPTNQSPYCLSLSKQFFSKAGRKNSFKRFDFKIRLEWMKMVLFIHCFANYNLIWRFMLKNETISKMYLRQLFNILTHAVDGRETLQVYHLDLDIGP